MKTVAVLITVYNRKEKTLSCLSNLYLQDIPKGCEIDIFLVDDGCTDGTPDAVSSLFPKVNVINGTGDLFWNRGMYTAWDTASSKRDYDFYIWLNDDTFLYPNALTSLLISSNIKEHKAIISGCVQSEKTGKVSYGGLSDNKLVSPNGLLQACDTTHGNIVLVPKYVFKINGNLDYRFIHAIGDLDYGLRAKSMGIKTFIAPDFLGVCEPNGTPKWCRKETPLLQRFKILYSPLGYSQPLPFFIYEKRHFGLVTALKHLCSIHLRALIPSLWKYKR